MIPQLHPSSSGSLRQQAFTLVEMLLVIAVIGIMSSMVISVYRNAAKDAEGVIARQQQAVLQNALNNWISSAATGSQSISSIRAAYTGKGTSWEKVDLFKDYLDPSTFQHFSEETTDNTKIKSTALKKTGQYLTLSTWTTGSGSYPKVNINSN